MKHRTTIARLAVLLLILGMLSVAGVLRAQEKGAPLLVMISMEGLRRRFSWLGRGYWRDGIWA